MSDEFIANEYNAVLIARDALAADLARVTAERDAARRDLRLCRDHDIVAKFRMIAAERDDLLDKLIAERTKADRAREGRSE